VKKTTSLELRQIPSAVAAGRERVWLAAYPGDITIDVDATLLNVHSDKQDAASTYKRGYGFHPLGAWCDTTNEPLAAMLRPGNAGSNDTDDHSSCWTRQWRCSRPTTGPATSRVTTRALCVTRSCCGPTRPERPTALSPALSRPTSSTRSSPDQCGGA